MPHTGELSDLAIDIQTIQDGRSFGRTIWNWLGALRQLATVRTHALRSCRRRRVAEWSRSPPSRGPDHGLRLRQYDIADTFAADDWSDLMIQEEVELQRISSRIQSGPRDHEDEGCGHTAAPLAGLASDDGEP